MKKPTQKRLALSRPKVSPLEAELAFQIRAYGLPEPVSEFPAIPGRKFRFDFCWVEHRLLLEVQGDVWRKGSHTSGVGVNRDCEKLCLAVLEGYRVLHVTGNQIKEGLAIRWIARALALTPEPKQEP